MKRGLCLVDRNPKQNYIWKRTAAAALMLLLRRRPEDFNNFNILQQCVAISHIITREYVLYFCSRKNSWKNSCCIWNFHLLLIILLHTSHVAISLNIERVHILCRSLILHKAQGTSDHAGYFFAGYGYFPYPNMTGKVYKHPDIRKFNLFIWDNLHFL